MAAGSTAATEVYLPFGGGSSPVVLIRTPYSRAGEGTFCATAAFLGKACVAQDTRGRFDSGGHDTVFRDDGPDGRATIEWIAKQPWCNGRIATFGGSALGITQYLAAPNAPTPLRCQDPLVATTDLYHHGFYQGGALREALIVNWLEGQGSAGFLTEALLHRLLSDWWRPVHVAEEAPMVHVAARIANACSNREPRPKSRSICGRPPWSWRRATVCESRSPGRTGRGSRSTRIMVRISTDR